MIGITRTKEKKQRRRGKVDGWRDRRGNQGNEGRKNDGRKRS